VVAVGVGRYLHAQSLSYTVADAQSLADAFEQVALVPKEQIARVVDGAPPAADAKAFEKLLDERFRTARPGDTLVLFFAGHGMTAPDRTTYLAPANFDPEHPAETGVSLSRLRTQMDQCQASVKFIFLDACFSGGFRTGSRLDGQAAVDLLKEARGTVAISSSTSQQESLESAQLGHGIFTYWLVRGLRGEANSQVDRRIDADELFRFIKDRVRQSALAEDGAQQQPTWGFDRMPDIPKVLDLKRPDRPSVLVPVKRVPMGTDADTLDGVLNVLESFPQANPRNAIGMAKWILAHAPAGSDLARRAQAHLDKIDAMLIDGTLSLPSPGEEE
jgi:hypothetical protein